MAYCSECGRELPDGAEECPFCARGAGSRRLPPLDINEHVGVRERERTQSFPPLFSEEQRKQREAAAQKNRSASSGKRGESARGETKQRKSFFLVLILVVIIAVAAATAIYIILPELKSSDEAPVLFLKDGMLYMIRGESAQDVCAVCDLSQQLAEAGGAFSSSERAAQALTDSMFYDQKNEELYFTDLCGGLYRVKINRLGSGKKDIRDRVIPISRDMQAGSAEAEDCLADGYYVAPELDSVFFIEGEGRSLCVSNKGRSAETLARGVAAYAVSESGASVLYLSPNGDGEYTMYILPLGSGGKLIKVDSRVSGVERLDSEFDMIWYTRHDDAGDPKLISVWIGGRSMEKERVLSGADRCCGFSEKGFFYSVSSSETVDVWDYIQDVSQTDADYSSYSTIRSILKQTTARHVSGTVSYWSEGGSVLLAENVTDWELLDEPGRIISADVCDFEKLGKISITGVKSALSAVEYVEAARDCTVRYICAPEASFEAGEAEYCCCSADAGVLWMIDKADGRGVLREYTLSENGLSNRVKLAIDVYAAAFQTESGRLFYLSDYNDSTRRCDLYVYDGQSSECVSYDVYLPDMEIAVSTEDESMAFMAAPVFDDGNAVCRLVIWSGGQARTAAESVTRFVYVSSNRVFWTELLDDGGTALVSYSAQEEIIAHGVSALSSPGTGGVIRFRGGR